MHPTTLEFDLDMSDVKVQEEVEVSGSEVEEVEVSESEVGEVEVSEPSDEQPATESDNSTADQENGGQQIEKDVSTEQDKRQARLKRLKELHMRRNEARKLNHSEVVEEDRRNKLPANWEARKRKAEWEQADDDAKKQAEEAGEDYERVKLLETSAADLERLERKRKKKYPDTGFADFSQAQFRQYERLTRQMAPDMAEYERMKSEMGDEDFYPGVNSLVHGGSGRVAKAGMDRMTGDLEKQIEKRAKFSRYRGSNEEADVDYINERNMKFNQKAARFYDKYTSETKQNLERGTAV